MFSGRLSTGPTKRKRPSKLSIEKAAIADRKLSYTPARARREEKWFFGKIRIIHIGVALVVLFAAAAVGLTSGLGLGRLRSHLFGSRGTFWKPRTGATWQIELLHALNDTSVNAEVYDIDLYTNTHTTINNLHNLGRKVICYFSAGTYEDYRPDHMLFKSIDYGHKVDDLHGEWWLDTRSSRVRALMRARLDLAAAKGCDGVDPDHTDSYLHQTGFPLTAKTALDYVKFLATEAHLRNLSIGLKNTGGLVRQTVDLMQWEINEDCELSNSCALYRPFISSGKPVFYIVYPGDSSSLSKGKMAKHCNSPSTQGFSTVFKSAQLDNWISTC